MLMLQVGPEGLLAGCGWQEEHHQRIRHAQHVRLGTGGLCLSKSAAGKLCYTQHIGYWDIRSTAYDKPMTKTTGISGPVHIDSGHQKHKL